MYIFSPQYFRCFGYCRFVGSQNLIFRQFQCDHVRRASSDIRFEGRVLIELKPHTQAHIHKDTHSSHMGTNHETHFLFLKHTILGPVRHVQRLHSFFFALFLLSLFCNDCTSKLQQHDQFLPEKVILS